METVCYTNVALTAEGKASWSSLFWLLGMALMMVSSASFCRVIHMTEQRQRKKGVGQKFLERKPK